jgi:hypothetical protein
MENPKIKPAKIVKPVVVFNYSEHKSIVSGGIVSKQNSKLEIFKYATKSSHIYSSVEYPGSDVFDTWCKHVNSISIDLQKEFDPSTEVLELQKFTHFNYWRRALSEFMEAIREHKEQQNEFKHTHAISIESAKRYLLLVPVLANHRPRVYIDASNGCFNVDLTTRDNGILSTQISDNGQIHYSYVSQNKKIFKITGTAKFKDSRDFIKFNKVLQML